MKGRHEEQTTGRDEVGVSLRLDVRLEVRFEAGGAAHDGDIKISARLLAAGAEREELAAGTRATARAELEQALANIGTILNRAMRWADPDQGSRELLRQQGEVLFDAILPSSVKAGLRMLEGGSLTIRGDEPELAIPWEVAHTGRDFLGLAFALGREPSGARFEGSRQGPPPSEWRTLVICDPRGDLIGSYYEGMALREELTQGGRGATNATPIVDLRASEVGLADVKRLLREYEVVHFAGHAEPGGGPERGWWLGDGVLGPTAVRELIGGRAFPRLIFSNACRSASEGGVNPATGLAAAFLDAGVELYIGTTQDVPDEPASLFALTFYKALLAAPGQGVGEALRVARVALSDRYGVRSVYWASWVLYGDPRGQCFGCERGLAATESRPVATRPIGLPALAAQIRGAAASAPAVVGLEAGWRLDPRRWPRKAWVVGATGTLIVASLMTLVLALRGSVGDGERVAKPTTEARGLGSEVSQSGSGGQPDHARPSVVGDNWQPGHARPSVVGDNGQPGHARPSVVTQAGSVSNGMAAFDAAAPAGPEIGDGAAESTGPTVPVDVGRKLALGVVRAPGAETPAGERAVLRSRESFRLEVEVGERGWIALWHVESQGSVRRIYPQDGMLAEVGGPATLVLPEGNRWFWLDNNVGTERFILAWREVAPSDPAGFQAELDQETRALGDALVEARRSARSPRLEMRGLGGTRAGESAALLLGRLREALDDRFERIEELVVEHR
ncbi:MAG: CHAT domain-containing protein [Deltaproteobacteria bacterium]|nr:CHAT domain-containing protein [Deltaproteobacteria bacterium]